MKKLKELYEKNPRKFFGIGLLILVFLISVIYGILGASEETEIDQNETAEEGVLIPVDTTNTDKSNEDAFFDIRVPEDTISNRNEYYNNQDKPKAVAPIRSWYNEQTSYKPQKNVDYSEPTTPIKSEDVKSTSKQKRRSPNDGFSIKDNKSSSANLVVDNRNRIVKNGSTVYFHVANDFSIDGVSLKKNDMIQGIANLNEERVQISVTTVKTLSGIKNVKWIVYDQGVKGIYVPEKVSTNIAKDAVGEDGRQVSVNAPVVGSVKVNLKKKIQEQSVVLVDGYKVTIVKQD